MADWKENPFAKKYEGKMAAKARTRALSEDTKNAKHSIPANERRDAKKIKGFNKERN